MGRLGGLSFPVDNAKGVQVLKFETPAIQGASLRWLSVAALPRPTLAVVVLIEMWDGQKWQSSPALLPLTAHGAAGLQAILAPDSATLTKPTLVADSSGNWYAAWMQLRANGSAAVYYASTR